MILLCRLNYENIKKFDLKTSIILFTFPAVSFICILFIFIIMVLFVGASFIISWMVVWPWITVGYHNTFHIDLLEEFYFEWLFILDNGNTEYNLAMVF